MSIEKPEQMVLPIALSDKASFENFYLGSNSELVHAIRSSVESAEPKLIYFYGNQSSGKSHLLFSATRLADTASIANSYLSLADPYVSQKMLEMVNTAGIVCIDNAHAWAGDEDKEQTLFALFEQVKHSSGRLLISAERTPDKCGFKLKDLISRLSSGLIYPLRDLSEEQQYQALKLRANHRALVISDKTFRYLLSRSSRDTSELFAILDRIDKTSLEERRKVTIPFLQAFLES